MSDKRDLAIRYITEDIQIHQNWLDYLHAEPEKATHLVRESDAVGDTDHHRKWIRRLRIVLRELHDGK